MSIVVIKQKASAEDLHLAIKVFDICSQYDTYTFGGEFKIDLNILDSDQILEIRECLSRTEINNISVYLSTEIELLDDGSLIVSGYNFILEDHYEGYKYSPYNRDLFENIFYGIPHPTEAQIHQMITPFLKNIKSKGL